MAWRVKYDSLDKRFIEIFSKYSTKKDNKKLIEKYIYKYIPLIDAYLSYNERYLYKEYIETKKEKYTWNSNRVNPLKTFGTIIKNHSDEGKLDVLVSIRNMIVHNSWIYSDQTNDWRDPKEYEEAVEYFIENTLPENFMKLLPDNIPVKDFVSQQEKFKKDIKTKVKYAKYFKI